MVSMSLRFRIFRRILLGLIALLSLFSIILSIILCHSFSHRRVFWMIILVQSACMARSLWSTLSKPLLKRAQSVAWEVVGLFVLLPFELILALVVISTPLQREPSPNLIYNVLQIFILINAIIDLGYMISLLVTAMITVPAYDQDVWVRDIDSSPSPFPISILFSFVFRRHFSSRSTHLGTTHGPCQALCLPGCNCTAKLHQPMSGIPGHASDTVRLPTSERRRSESLSGSLVRIPNAAERRASIILAFEVRN